MFCSSFTFLLADFWFAQIFLWSKKYIFNLISLINISFILIKWFYITKHLFFGNSPASCTKKKLSFCQQLTNCKNSRKKIVCLEKYLETAIWRINMHCNGYYFDSIFSPFVCVYWRFYRYLPYLFHIDRIRWLLCHLCCYIIVLAKQFQLFTYR